LDPFSYVIRDGKLWLIDFLAFLDQYDKKEEFLKVAGSDSFAQLRSIVAEKLDLQSAGLCSIPVECASLIETYERAVKGKDPANQVLISPMPRNQAEPYIPGSSIKGAIRTGLANALARVAGVTSRDTGKSKGAGDYNKKIFGQIKNDPMKWIKVWDVPLKEWGTAILEAREISKNPDRTPTPKGHVEAAYSLCQRNQAVTYPLHLSMESFMLHNTPVTPHSLLDMLCAFYVPKYEEEYRNFYTLSDVSIRERIKPMNKVVRELKTNEALLRIGHFSHVECMTLDDVRKPWTRKGRDGKPLPWGTTRTLGNGVYPFGWAKLEFNDIESLPRPGREWPFVDQQPARPMKHTHVPRPSPPPKAHIHKSEAVALSDLMKQISIIRPNDRLALERIIKAIDALLSEEEQRQIASLIKNKLEAAGMWKKHPMKFDIEIFLPELNNGKAGEEQRHHAESQAGSGRDDELAREWSDTARDGNGNEVKVHEVRARAKHIATDPTGRSFLSYRRIRNKEAALLIAAQHEHGIPTWQDIQDLGTVPTEDQIRRILDDPSTASAVLLITPEVEESAIIRGVEIPRIIKRSEASDGFFVVPVAVGVSDYEEAGKVTSNHLSAQILSDWNIERIPSKVLSTSDAITIANRILIQRMQAIHTSLTDGLPIQVGFFVRYSPGFLTGNALTLDWSERFIGKETPQSVWNQELLPALSCICNAIRKYAPGREIIAFGSPTLSAAIAFGCQFTSNSGLRASWRQVTRGQPDQLWNLDAKRIKTGFQCRNFSKKIDASDFAVLVSVEDDVEPPFAQTQPALPPLRAMCHIRKEGEIPYHIESPGEALDIATTVQEAMRSLRREYGRVNTVHLFAAVPAGLAMLIGQLLNTFPAVQTYEYVPDGGKEVYRPAALLRPSD
jgi:hypothetical protein